ncbi:D-alanyl-D-alanine carboxypeptidase family protein [Lentilitoribacter sp. EG35]|jgi:D-alanyl-D-alanine carboxypeptidase|uniref:D-alanyl-D-alanine carboxypeptidase family protein n=1 Tax=Lentilitoribacter sp. EG35 TaxID=3234192 RepID=UPI003460A73E
MNRYTRLSTTQWLRAFAVVLSVIIFSSFSFQSTAFAGPYITVDAGSGRVINHDQAFQKWYPASITKIMTAYLAFKAVKSGRLSMKSMVTMSKYAASKPASKMYFKPGTQFTLDSGLKFLLVKSANDVAVAIAETISGSEQAFVNLMNREAKRIGMISTRFANPNGLPGGTQYTTARDLAVLAVTVRREFPRYQSYFSLEGFSTGKKKYTNYNLLLGRFAGANGMKTGFICASGFNLVGSATRGGKSIITVVLGAKSQEARAELAAELLQAGFRGKRTNAKLSTLQPYGATRNQLANIRNQICTKEARAARYDGRDVEGKMVLKSPYIKAMRREPRVVSAPFSAVVAASAKLPRSRNVPIPAPRPKR